VQRAANADVDAGSNEPPVVIRAARSDEGERLREIALASKGYWGYDRDLVRQWTSGLDLSPAGLRKKEFYVAEIDGRLAGWSALIDKGEVCWLDDLWIEPQWIGRGIGSKLFEHAAARGRELGARRMEWEAERHSVGFYEKMGGRYLRDSQPGVWGRISPVMGLSFGPRLNRNWRMNSARQGADDRAADAVRAARAEDLEALLAIQWRAAATAFSHVFPQDRYPFPSDHIRDDWRAALANPDVEVYVFEYDANPVASVSLGGDLLRTLYVLPAHQARGIGSMLHDMALERLRTRGVKRAKLWTLEENWPARRFYEQRGWALTAESRVVPFPPHPLDVQYARNV